MSRTNMWLKIALIGLLGPVAATTFADFDDPFVPARSEVQGASGRSIVEEDPFSPPSPHVKQCTVNGVSFTDPLKWLAADPFAPYNVYATCEDGKATCFASWGQADRVNARIMDCAGFKWDVLNSTSAPRTVPWLDGIVCYQFSMYWEREERTERFHRVTKQYMDHANVTFLPYDECMKQYKDTPICNGCKSFITVSDIGDFCYASMGMPTEDQHHFYPVVNVGAGCDYDFIYLHQIGHTIGLRHMHSHPNRTVIALKEHMTVDTVNYMRMPSTYFDGLEYDMNSVMHFRGDVFCIPKDPSIKFCDVQELPHLHDCVLPTEEDCDRSKQDSIGHIGELRPSDIAALQRLYGKAE